MWLTKSQIETIDYSWEIICENPNAMLKFYHHLFEIAPETIHFFPDDVSKQSEKLVYTLGFIVANLDRLEEINESIYDLGRFHNQLEIESHHYASLKIALNMTLREIMGNDYNNKVGETWDLVLDYLSDLMISAPPKKNNTVKILLQKLFFSGDQASYKNTF